MPLYDNLGYGNEKTPVVFDIGSAYTKCGFAGENSPRCIIPSQVKRPRSGQVVAVTSAQPEDLYGVLVDFIHVLFFRHALVNPKDRRIVIVESVLTTSKFRETLALVLFKHFEVPSVLFAPSHLMALFTLGIPSALVMDCGYAETQVLPVCEGIPILKGCQSLPLAGKAIHNYLEAMLKESATTKEGQGEAKPLSSVRESLEETILEDIKVKCCFVTKLSRAKLIQGVQAGEDGEQLPTPPPDVSYPLAGQSVLNIPGKIREQACEILFEQDNEEKSVATLILDSIIQCPIDMRKTLAENILLMGGTSMLPGFRHRILTELHDLITKSKYKQRLSLKTFKFHSVPAKENFVAWLGGAIFGALEILASRTVSRDVFNQNGQKLPDWCCLLEFDDKEEQASVLLHKEASKEGASLVGVLRKDRSMDSAVLTKGT